MAMSNTAKTTGRTPPFVLVALLLLLIVLGYNYWLMSSSNRQLREINAKVLGETRDTEEKRLAVEKGLQAAREELRVVQGNLNQQKAQLQQKDTELNNLRAEEALVKDGEAKCKELAAKCDADLQTEKKNSETLTAEKVKLEEELKKLKDSAKPQECTSEQCISPVKNVLTIVTKLVGTDNLSKVLTEANLDAKKLMEGIPKIDAPAKEPDQAK